MSCFGVTKESYSGSRWPGASGWELGYGRQKLIGTGGAGGWFGADSYRESGRAFDDVITTGWIADVGQLAGIQLVFVLSCGYCGETRCAD